MDRVKHLGIDVSLVTPQEQVSNPSETLGETSVISDVPDSLEPYISNNFTLFDSSYAEQTPIPSESASSQLAAPMEKSSPAMEALLQRLEELKNQKTDLAKQIRELEAALQAALAAARSGEPQSPDLIDLALGIVTGGALGQAHPGDASVNYAAELMRKIADLKSQLAKVEVQIRQVLNEMDYLQTQQAEEKSLQPDQDQQFQGSLNPTDESLRPQQDQQFEGSLNPTDEPPLSDENRNLKDLI